MMNGGRVSRFNYFFWADCPLFFVPDMGQTMDQHCGESHLAPSSSTNRETTKAFFAILAGLHGTTYVVCRGNKISSSSFCNVPQW